MESKSFDAGDTVKFSQPQDAAEATARFEVVEIREAKGTDTAPTRVLIRLVCDLPFRPTELVLLSDIELAQ